MFHLGKDNPQQNSCLSPPVKEGIPCAVTMVKMLEVWSGEKCNRHQVKAIRNSELQHADVKDTFEFNPPEL